MTHITTSRSLSSLASSREEITVDEFIAIAEDEADQDVARRAELIDGVVILNPAISRYHGRPQYLLASWLSHYEAQTEAVEGFPSISLILDKRNMPEPDACLRIREEYGGQSMGDRYVRGAAEFVAEVSVTSELRDLGKKRDLYERIGVQEYLVWRVEEREIVVFERVGGLFQERTFQSGVIQSKVFGGLWFDVEAALNENLPRLFRTLDEGLKSEDHSRFIEEMSRLKRTTK